MSTPNLRRWGAIALMALALSSCGGAQASPPTPTAPATAPPATPTLPPTVTPTATENPATATRAPTITPSVTPDLPIETPLPGTLLPVIDGEVGFILGGSRDGVWLDSSAMAAALKGEVRYRLFKDGLPAGDLTASLIPPIGVCDRSPRVARFSPERVDTIGVPGGWDVAPRKIEPLGLKVPEYISAVETALAENGVTGSEVILTEVSRVDLDGDGIGEVLIGAAKLAGLREGGRFSYDVNAGDYSVVLLRKAGEDGTVTTSTLHIITYHETRVATGYPELMSVLTVLDLNGDGIMEVIVERRGLESRFLEVYALDGDEVRQVMMAGCSV